jgi:hypothetical protein
MKSKSFLITIAILIIVIRSSAQETATFTDSRDGKIYQTVIFGDQTWMAENLNYETPDGSWCYENDPSSCSKYGRLYDWETAKKVAPIGWHLPSEDEWLMFLAESGSDDLLNGSGCRAGNGNFQLSRLCFWSSTDDEIGALHVEFLFDMQFDKQKATIQSDDVSEGYHVRLVKD